MQLRLWMPSISRIPYSVLLSAHRMGMCIIGICNSSRAHLVTTTSHYSIPLFFLQQDLHNPWITGNANKAPWWDTLVKPLLHRPELHVLPSEGSWFQGRAKPLRLILLIYNQTTIIVHSLLCLLLPLVPRNYSKRQSHLFMRRMWFQVLHSMRPHVPAYCVFNS